MILTAISMETRKDLVFITDVDRGLNIIGLRSARYIEEILTDHVVPYAKFIGDNFTYMQDNPRRHIAIIVR